MGNKIIYVYVENFAQLVEKFPAEISPFGPFFLSLVIGPLSQSLCLSVGDLTPPCVWQIMDKLNLFLMISLFKVPRARPPSQEP